MTDYMEGIFSWLLSIVGIILLGVLVDIILPEGKLRKYIHSLYVLIVLLVILSPLAGLKNVEFSWTFESSDYYLNDSYISNTYRQKISVLEKDIENKLSANDCAGVVISIIVNEHSKNMLILQIVADTTEMQTSLSMAQAQLKIIEVVRSVINIETEKVVIL